MQLSFYARGDGLVREPNVIELVGTAPHYVGRTRVQLTNGRFGYPAVEEPYCVPANSDGARHLVKLTARDKALWPADKETAQACDVEFVPLKFADGEWVAEPAPKSPRQLKLANVG